MTLSLLLCTALQLLYRQTISVVLELQVCNCSWLSAQPSIVRNFYDESTRRL